MSLHKLTDVYLKNVDRFTTSFPVAHAFLRRLEVEGPTRGMWLSSAVNVHLYKGDAFLAYLKLKNPELKPPSLVISPKFNQQIAAHTSDESRRLFPQPFDGLIGAQGGFRDKWAVRHARGETEFTVATPATFFDALYAAVVAIDVWGAGKPAAGGS
jgi:hypothetical protein